MAVLLSNFILLHPFWIRLFWCHNRTHNPFFRPYFSPPFFFKKGIKILLVNSSLVCYSNIMKKFSLLVLLFLAGCAYRNPLEKADFRFQTLMVSPYVLSSWYHISEPGKPLTVSVEDYETPPSETVRQKVVQDKGANVAYIGRPCQYFQTSICEKKITSTESDKIIRKGIEQLK